MRFLRNQINIDNLSDETTSHGRFYTTPSGKKYPSITTVLKHLSENAITQWRKNVGEEEANRVSHHASIRGSAIHDLMERYIKGEDINPLKIMTLYRPSFKKLTPILDENLSEVYAQEIALYSDKLRVAGRTDLIGKFNKKNSVVDFKTSRRVKTRSDISGYFMQTCAYAIMFEERTGINISNLVIIMDIDGHDPVVFEENRIDWESKLYHEIGEYYRIHS